MKNEQAKRLYDKAIQYELDRFLQRMPDGKKGAEVEINGRKYIAAIRRLTPTECGRLQGVPEWYDWSGISDTQQYKMMGNGWQCDTIKHCWSFLPDFGRPIRVWSLFDGMSCAGVTLRELNIPVEVLISSEVDKHAIAAEKLNFPNMVQVGSVTDINVAELVEKYGIPDFICGGSPCFAEHTKVLTSKGYKNIEDVQVGDMVLTHENRYRKVLAIGNKTAMTYDLSAQGFVTVRCTANHPFYARKKRFLPCVQDNGRATRRLELGETEWVQAEKLVGKYYVAQNVEQQPSENPLNITKEEAWVIGRYIADGHTRKDRRFNGGHNGSRVWQLILSIGDKKLEQFKSHISELHYSCYPHSQGVHRVVFSNKRLVEIAEAQCGCGALSKHFGEALIKLPNDILETVLKGFLEGDGSYDEEKKVWNITTVSKMLPMTIQRVISKLYGRHICVTRHNPPEYKTLCGRMVHQNPQYFVCFSPYSIPHEKPIRIEQQIWSGVKTFKPIGKQIVYNLEVEEDNSYTANNFVVHNCQSFSFSGTLKGMATKSGEEIYTLDRYLQLKNEGFEFEGQSYLFWEYMRILTELRKFNPNIYFFLENVEMLEKWERCLSHAIGIRGVHINSALVSAQQRKRIYWSNIRVKQIGDSSLFDFSNNPFEWPTLTTDIPQPEDRGIVIKDILMDDVDSKYYLNSDVVKSLIDRTDKRKLKDYMETPQLDKDELLRFMETDEEYAEMNEDERKSLAKTAYILEKQRLKAYKYEEDRSLFDS